MDRCFCGGLLYPGTTTIVSTGGVLMVACWRCSVCGQEEIDAAISRSALETLRSGTLWSSASTSGGVR